MEISASPVWILARLPLLSMMILTIYFDGSCAPKNPGGIAIAAFLVTDEDGTVIHQEADEICRGPTATVNVAEWAAVLGGVSWVRQNHPTAKIRIVGDSQLVIRQLTGVYECRKEHLRPYKDTCLVFLENADWDAIWVPREQNTEADQLTRDKYDEILGKSFESEAKIISEKTQTKERHS